MKNPGGTVSRFLFPRFREWESFLLAAYTRDRACAWERAAPQSSIWPCTGWGFPCPRRLLAGRWALTPPFHPYRAVAREAVCSLWHYPSKQAFGCLSRVYPRSKGAGYAASCPVVIGLSSRRLRRRAIPRSSGVGKSSPFLPLPQVMV